MYIALKPIRFDKDYCVGEEIPEKVVDPKMEATLIKRGSIAKAPDVPVQVPDSKGNAPDGADSQTPDSETVNLEEMKKDELLKYAAEFGLDADDKMTKDEIKKLIVEAQQGGEGHE